MVIDKIKKLVESLSSTEQKQIEPLSAEEQEQIIQELLGAPPQEPDLRLIGLFTEVMDEKVAELVHALLYLDEVNKVRKEDKPIGFYVCTEKPMATKWEDGLKMLEACKKNKVKLFVVKQNRFNKTIDLVRRQILNGRF